MGEALPISNKIGRTFYFSCNHSVVLSLKFIYWHVLDGTTNRSGKLFKGAHTANGNFFHGIRNSQSTTRTRREMMARVGWTANR